MTNHVKKSILITGASSGFGLSLALRLHERGHKVIGTSRTPEKHADRVPFSLVRLDLDDDRSIAELESAVFKITPALDVLVNNAGYMLSGIAEETPIDLGRQQFETNFWGTVKLTMAILPKFRAQKRGQIITVSSIVALIGPPNLSYYVASKHAVEGFFKSLRFELDQFNIRVNMVEPIWFKTNIGNHAVRAQGGQLPDYDGYRGRVDHVTRQGLENAEPPDAVAERLIQLIESPKPSRFSNPVGKMTGVFLFLQTYLPSVFEGSILKCVRSAPPGNP